MHHLDLTQRFIHLAIAPNLRSELSVPVSLASPLKSSNASRSWQGDGCWDGCMIYRLKLWTSTDHDIYHSKLGAGLFAIWFHVHQHRSPLVGICSLPNGSWEQCHFFDKRYNIPTSTLSSLHLGNWVFVWNYMRTRVIRGGAPKTRMVATARAESHKPPDLRALPWPHIEICTVQFVTCRANT